MKKIRFISILFMNLILVNSCLQEVLPEYLTISTGPAEEVTDSLAKVYGIGCEQLETLTKEGFKFGFMYSSAISMTDFKTAYVDELSSSFGFETILKDLLPGTTYYYCAFTGADGNLIKGDIKSFTTSFIDVKAIDVSPSEMELYYGSHNTLTAVFHPENASNRSHSWSSSDESIAYIDDAGCIYGVGVGTAVITVTSFDGSCKGICNVNIVEKKEAVPEAVDMGLSVKWASFNLGAEKPEEFGDYYAWGEIDTYYELGQAQNINQIWKRGKDQGYDWSVYKWGHDEKGPFSKYSSDGKIVLEEEDDVAHVKLGDEWRMPTEQEFNELMDPENCTLDWWSSRNGMMGLLVTSKKTGNSIFLPFAGQRDRIYYNANNDGYYWTSSLQNQGKAIAAKLYLFNQLIEQPRCLGFSVRPIYGDPVNANTLCLSEDSIELYVREGKSLTASLLPDNCTYKVVRWESSNPSVATVSDNGIVTAVSPGNATITCSWVKGEDINATCSVTVSPYDYSAESVDLGLSVKWASRNVGASNPWENGDFFAWGEVEPHSNLIYNNYNYKWYTSWNGMITKYNNDSSYGSIDSKTVLEKEDDAAYVNSGNGWRMPTADEFRELINPDNCSWEWTIINEVNVVKITSKKNGNCLFLPAAGYYFDFYNSHTGYFCDYWSSSLQKSIYGMQLEITVDEAFLVGSNRICGMPVRAVKE